MPGQSSKSQMWGPLQIRVPFQIKKRIDILYSDYVRISAGNKVIPSMTDMYRQLIEEGLPVLEERVQEEIKTSNL